MNKLEVDMKDRVSSIYIQVLKIIEDEENAAPRIFEEHGEDPDQYGW